ncbi:alpha/beta hydrolase [Caulobacter endophyticus]|uniref:alpha/beta hydrolase n=1 Tax=Caulobacter endophyticus TaxID=2172652 RepID=UPI001E5998B7|nr:alpha/beta hydrolase [Caulobacter endophyticus]
MRGAFYGDHPRQRLDVYAPARGAGDWPVLVFFYGGAWNSGCRRDYAWAARALAAQGFVVVMPDYRLHPEVVYPAFLEDAALAVRWAVKYAPRLGGNPARLSLSGHSAGAYIAAMLALDPSWLRGADVAPGAVKAFAGLSGPYAILPLDGPITTRTFGHVEDLPATQPTSFARADAPAAFLATGEDDHTVRPRNTRKLAKVLRAAGAVVEEQVYPGLDHAAPLLALSRPFRRKAPVLAQMTGFLRAKAG